MHTHHWMVFFLCFCKSNLYEKNSQKKKIHLKMVVFSTHTHKHKLPQRSSSWPLATIPPTKTGALWLRWTDPYPFGDPIYRRYMKMFSIYCRRLEIVMPPLGVFSGRWRAEELDFWTKKILVFVVLVDSTMPKSSWKPHHFGEYVWERSPGIFTANRSFWLGGMVQPWKVIWLAGKSPNLF